MWFVKSLMAGVSDFLSLIDNVDGAIISLNTYIASALPTSWVIPGANFSPSTITKTVTNILRLMLSAATIVVIGLIYLGKVNSLSNNQFIWETLFFMLYVGENLAKVVLYGARTFDLQIIQLEQFIYLMSATLEFFEMVTTVIGLTP